MGRLIDADKLEYTCNSDECGMLTGCNHCQYNIITEDEIDSAPTVEAIPKDQYETRLKADMVAMLTEILLEAEENTVRWYVGRVDGKSDDVVLMETLQEIVQQKINALKGDTDGDK